MNSFQSNILKHHHTLTIEQRELMIRLHNLTQAMSHKSYHIGQGIDHNDVEISQTDYDNLISQEIENQELIENIWVLLEYKEYDRLPEVSELISESVKESIEKSTELIFEEADLELIEVKATCSLKYDHHFLKGTGIPECPECGECFNQTLS